VPIASFDAFQQLIELVRMVPRDYDFGLHFHLASSDMGSSAWKELFLSMLQWARAIEETSGVRVAGLDIGGGWSPDDWRTEFRGILPQVLISASQSLPHLKRLIVEPGRALVQNGMALATRVLDVRRERCGITEVVVDASVADLPSIGSYPHRFLWLNRNSW